ncbi:MAG: hypothetical protein HY080_11615 [Gammaproteobacteria bacterium]|nr:hypothetical protein [Gammaproteobacteria bacterium]
MRRRSLYFLLSILTSDALAGNAVGKITSITVADNSASILFKLDAPITDTPRCNETNRFSINLMKPGGMAAYIALLQAKQQNYRVTVTGLNTCSNEWMSEDSKNIILE